MRVRGPSPLLAQLDSVIASATAEESVGRATRLYRIETTQDPSLFVLRCEGANFSDAPSPAAHVVQAIHEDALAYVTERARTHAFVHAGVVGWKGTAIVIPGRTRTGKSSLVAALIRAGALYYSDEYAPIDADGRVHPYARPLVLRGPTGRVRHTAAAVLGARTGVAPLRVGFIVTTRYQPRARWRPIEQGPGQGLLALLDNAVAARTRTAFVLPRLRRAVDGAIVLDGTRGGAETTAAKLLERAGLRR